MFVCDKHIYFWIWLHNYIILDINECDVNNPCHFNANCTNEPGNYTCTCLPGYLGDGKFCRGLWFLNVWNSHVLSKMILSSCHPPEKILAFESTLYTLNRLNFEWKVNSNKSIASIKNHKNIFLFSIITQKLVFLIIAILIRRLWLEMEVFIAYAKPV